jgi:hypothetical protein
MKFPEGIKVYGDKAYRDKKCPKEVMEQVTFFNQLRGRHPETYGAIAVHVRNEGKKTVNQVAKEKAEGMVTGACDIMIPGVRTFICELKRRDHTESKIQKEQIDYMLAAQRLGAFVCIALGWEAAMEAFEEWASSTTN